MKHENLPDDVTLDMIDGKSYRCDECGRESCDDNDFLFDDEGNVRCQTCFDNAMEDDYDDPDEGEDADDE